MTAIPQDSQLSIFDSLVTIFRNSSTISDKFATTDFYQYEPKHKSRAFNGFPYFLIQLPSTSTDLLVVDHSLNIKGFTISIFIRVEYGARANVLSYVNAAIRQIESSETTLQSLGYYNPEIELISINGDQVIDSKEIVEAELQLNVDGYLTR